MPAVANILVSPRVDILEDCQEEGGTGRRAVLSVRGLLCGLCAGRVQGALKRLPFVSSVKFKPEPEGDCFVVNYDSATSRAEALRRAALSTVVAPGLRELLARAADRGNGRL